jgi:DNA-binding transcriptional LysR family regulator
MFADINPAIDVRMLRTLHVLLAEQNVSRAALLLGQSQPAVSQTLKKARAIFADPLLVRSGQVFVLTERGEEVRRSVETVLKSLAEALAPTESFDPARAQGRMRVAAVNCFGTFLIPAIGALIRREAPGLAVDFFAPSERLDLAQELASGRAEIVIGNWPAPAPSLRHSALLECGIACVVRSSHPVVRRADFPLDLYLELDHVSPTPGSNAAFSPIDGRLSQLGSRRRIAMSVPEYALIPAILADTDLIFTTARPYAEHIVASSPSGHLSLVEAPAEFQQMNLYLLWHERVQASPRNRWIRNVVKRVAKRFDLTLHSAGGGQFEGKVSDFVSL